MKRKIIKLIRKILPNKIENMICAILELSYEYSLKQKNMKLIEEYTNRGGVWIGSPKRWEIKSTEQLKIGDHVSLGAESDIWIHDKNGLEQQANIEKYEGKVIIGNNVHIGERLKIDCYSEIKIQDDCLLATNISFIDCQHGMNPELAGSYVLQPSIAQPVFIGKGVWIGEGVTILSGSTIGERAIIGARAVVKGNIPPYTIAVGIPAKVIKKWDFVNKKWGESNNN